MLDTVLELEDFDELLYNDSIIKCPTPTCDFTANTVGAMNYHIGRNHLGQTPLLRNKPKSDKK